jgi:hypothetical protein
VLHWNHSMTVDCWIQYCVSWLPTHVLVGVSAAVTINSTQTRQFKCRLRILTCLLILCPYFQTSTPVALYSIVLKLYMCIYLNKCSRYIQLYFTYRVDLGLLHTGRSDLDWKLYKWRTIFDCSLLMSSTLL